VGVRGFDLLPLAVRLNYPVLILTAGKEFNEKVKTDGISYVETPAQKLGFYEPGPEF